jgi:trimeric autotransporter adhesin
LQCKILRFAFYIMIRQLIILLLVSFSISSYSQVNIHYWDFNTAVTAVGTNKWPSPLNSALSATNVTTGVLTHNFTATDNFAGSSIDDAPIFTSTAGLSLSVLDQANNNNALILNVPTTNYNNIKFTYTSRGTSTGFSTHKIEYSTDGIIYILKNTITGRTSTSFSLLTEDFSAIAACNNNPNFKIKITISGATNASGNNRFDNFRVQGAPVVANNTVTATAGNKAGEPTTNGSFNLSLSNPAPVGGVVVNYTLGGTAITGTDYTDPLIGSITIPAGASTAVITLNTIDDIIGEPTKNVTLTLNNANNGFNVATSIPVINFFDNDGFLGGTYNFNNCGNYLLQGFTQYSVTGAQAWTCIKQGRTYTVDPSSDSAIQMNGFFGTGPLVNEDWLISPSFNLTGTTNPIIQFYTRSKFAGNVLELKVSTNYMPGTNPTTATWTTINGNFPTANSDVWILSDNIDLSSFIQPSVYIAWVYTSTATSATRWSLDDIRVDAGCTPPTSQATILNLTSTLTSISGSFTPSTPLADGYLVIASTSPTLSSPPVSNTVYAVDDIIGNGTVVSVNNSTTFNINNLNPATTFYFTIYAYSALQNCYLLVNPLTGNIATKPSPICTPPSTQATNITATNITATSMDISFTRGNGDNILVVSRTNTSVNQNPIIGLNYIVGSQIGNGNFVVYNGPASGFSYTALTQNTTYYFALYEYFNTDYCYNGIPLIANFTTTCVSPINVSAVNATAANAQATISWFNPTASCYDDIIVVASNAPITGVGSDYTGAANTVYATPNQVVYTGTSNNVVVTGLTNGVIYYFKIFTRKGATYSTGTTISIAPFNPALGFQYLYGNLHSHSSYSDGNKEDLSKKPIDDFRYGRDANCMDFLGISEHNHSGAGMALNNFILGYNDANTVNLEVGGAGNTMVTLWGMEWGVISGGGHVLTYGFDDKLIGWETGNYNIFCAKNDYASLFNLVNGQTNAFATLAHPNRNFLDFGNIVNNYSASADNAIVGTVIESGPAFSTNISYSHFPSPLEYFDYYKAMLAKGYKLGPTMDGDNHYFTFGRQSTNRLVVLANSKTRADVISAIKEMRFFASNDCNVKIDFKCYTNVMGSSLSHANLPIITLNVTDVDAGEATDSIYIYGGKVGDPAPLEPIKKYANTSSITFDATDALNTQPDNTTYYYFTVAKQVDGNRTISAPIWYTRNDLLLPITLLSFNAALQTNKTVLVKWATAQEVNNKIFMIEKSIDGGVSFNTIGTVNAIGNSSLVSNYEFTDLSPQQGVNLYRLKQMDVDGKFTYSKVVAISLSQTKTNYYSLYPTITNQLTTINTTTSSQKNIVVSIYNEASSLVQNGKYIIDKNHPATISVSNLKAGIYFVKINDGNEIVTRKLMVQ